MTIVRTQVSFPAASADSEDLVMNTWHFDITDAHTEGNCTPVANALDTFYTSLITLLNTSITWTNGRIKMYDLSESTPRAPIYDQPFVISGTPSASWLPAELAVCLTYQAVPLSGVRQSRRRGRIYLGPWSSAANSTTSGTISSSTYTPVATAATALLVASDSAAGWAWIVHSETASGNSVVDNGWVDNAWDVQRRRGTDATVRVTF